MNEENQPLVVEISSHISSNNQDKTRFSKPQQEVLVLHPSNFYLRLKLALANVGKILSSQNVSN